LIFITSNFQTLVTTHVQRLTVLEQLPVTPLKFSFTEVHIRWIAFYPINNLFYARLKFVDPNSKVGWICIYTTEGQWLTYEPFYHRCSHKFLLIAENISMTPITKYLHNFNIYHAVCLIVDVLCQGTLIFSHILLL
jgi:hypothetical protein